MLRIERSRDRSPVRSSAMKIANNCLVRGVSVYFCTISLYIILECVLFCNLFKPLILFKIFVMSLKN